MRGQSLAKWENPYVHGAPQFLLWPIQSARCWVFIPSFPGDPTGTVSLGAMPPASALASVPLFQDTSYGAYGLSMPMSGGLAQTVVTSHADVPELAASAPTAQGARLSHVPPISLGLSLSPATAPFPQRLVDKVRSGQFVEMRDLLVDNISLLQQLDTFGGQYSGPTLPGTLRPRLREVASLPSWMYCFMAYVAMRATDPGVRDMLAYARLVIREAQRHGGSGWLDYDRVFRQQAALDPSLKWNTLHPGIQASTLVGRTSRPATFCTLCREPDHTSEQCALIYLQPPGSHLPLSAPSSGLISPSAVPARPRAQFRRHPGLVAGICVSWNKGRCGFPNSCKYRHICATCQQPHMARDCAATPMGSEYKNVGILRAQGDPTPYSHPKPLL